MKKKIVAAILMLTMAVGLTACGEGAKSDTSETKEAKTEESSDASASDLSDQLYIQVSAINSDPYFYDHKMGMEMAGKELGVRTEFVGPAELDMNAMVTAFEQAIAKKPNGIVVVGFNEQLTPTIKKAMDAGIPVVTVDADLPDSGRIAFVGTGNIEAGMKGGEKMKELLGDKGKVAIMYNPGQTNLEERVEGYKQAFEGTGIEVVEEVDTKQDSVIAAQNIAAVLQKHPDLNGIVCVDATGGTAAATAVREAGRVGDVKIIAMDRSNEILEAIEDGIISASVAQQTALMPYCFITLGMPIKNSEEAEGGRLCLNTFWKQKES